MTEDLIVIKLEKNRSKTIPKKVLIKTITTLLYLEDFININCGNNTKEYDIEAVGIVSLLPDATSAKDVQDIVYQVFYEWFGGEDMKPKKSAFANVSKAIWYIIKGKEIS